MDRKRVELDRIDMNTVDSSFQMEAIRQEYAELKEDMKVVHAILMRSLRYDLEPYTKAENISLRADWKIVSIPKERDNGKFPLDQAA